jgi:hypothetical protein
MLDYKLYTPSEWRIADCIEPEDIQVLVMVQVREFYRQHALHRGRSGSFAHYAAAIDRIIGAIQECAWREQEQGIRMQKTDSVSVSMAVARVMFGRDAGTLTQIRKALMVNSKRRDEMLGQQDTTHYLPPVRQAMHDIPHDEHRH